MRPIDARGTKRTCNACGSRFYDLGRAEIACPACTVMFVPPPFEEVPAYDAPPVKKSWSRNRPPPRPVVVAAEAEEPAEAVLDGDAGEEPEDGETEKADGFADDLLLEADLTESDDDVVAVPRDEEPS